MKHLDYTPAVYQSPNDAGEKTGPAMKALNPRQQAVVHYLLDTGQVDNDAWTEAAKAAGYSQDGSYGALRVTAHRLRHNQAITDAIIEESRRRVGNDLPMAMRTIRTIASDPAHKDGLKAAITMAAMSGVSAISVSKVESHVTHHGSLMDEVRAAAAILGIDAEELMHGRMKDVTPAPKQIEARDPLDISDLY